MSSPIIDILAKARSEGASDIHLLADSPVAMRVARQISTNGLVATQEQLQEFVNATFTEADLGKMRSYGSADRAITLPNIGTARCHVCKKRGKLSLAIRMLHKDIPTIDGLKLPAVFHSFAQRSAGLVLVVGPTGSGKTSAQAATVNAINELHQKHIHIIEDTIEYEHPSINSIISQVEVGVKKDFADFSHAVEAALRDDIDVLVVGEATNAEAMQGIIRAADNGHFVMATLHTDQTTHAIDRILTDVDVDDHARVRSLIAGVLVAVVGLRLVPKKGRDNGLTVASEVLIVNDQIRDLLKTNDVQRVREIMENDKSASMHTLEQDLNRLVSANEIYREAALSAARYPEEISA